MTVSGSYIGFHMQDPYEQWDQMHNHAYLAGRRFRLLKSFHPEDQARLHAVSPGTAFIYRHHIQQSHQGEFIERAIVSPAEADRAADDYIRQFSDSVNQHMIGGYAESLNEEYPTRNPEKLAKIVAFDRAFVRRLPVICPGVKPIVFTAAIGNPDHHEYGALVDLARETAAAGGAFGYHPYWTVYNRQSFVNNAAVARDLHMRWDVIDEYLVARGIRVNWMLGETGATKGDANGYNPDVIAGWKHHECWGGDEDAYLADIAAFDELLAGTRAAREGRLIGAALFTSRPGDGGTWQYFNVTGSMAWKVANYVASKAPVVLPPDEPAPPPPPDNIPLPSRIIDYVDELPVNVDSPDWPYETRPLDGVTDVIIHHSVGLPTNPPESIAIGHNNRGWPGIGYHFYIMGDGRIYKTNHLTTHSYHAGTANRTSIGVCLAGDFTNVHPSPAQLDSARFLIQWLAGIVPGAALTKHRDFMATACPGATWAEWWDYLTDGPPPPEPRQWSKLVYLLPQQATREQYATVADIAHPTRSEIAFSADSAFARPAEVTGQRVIVYDVEAWGGRQALEDWVMAHYAYDPATVVEYRGWPGSEPTAFDFHVWPTTERRVTQRFGVNRAAYEPYGLPGHEGIDLASPLGSPYYCVAPGTVIWASNRRRSDGVLSAYGWHVIVDHGDGYTTLYAHAQSTLPVMVGDRLEAGDVVARSGNTGNSSGAHLHITIKKEGYQLPGWPAGYMNPTPFIEKFNPTWP